MGINKRVKARKRIATTTSCKGNERERECRGREKGSQGLRSDEMIAWPLFFSFFLLIIILIVVFIV